MTSRRYSSERHCRCPCGSTRSAERWNAGDEIVLDVPNRRLDMLVDEAESVDDAEHDRLLAKAEAEGRADHIDVLRRALDEPAPVDPLTALAANHELVRLLTNEVADRLEQDAERKPQDPADPAQAEAWPIGMHGVAQHNDCERAHDDAVG